MPAGGRKKDCKSAISKLKRVMPNQRDPNKRQIGCWITEGHMERIEETCKKMGITISDYIKIKLDAPDEDIPKSVRIFDKEEKD